MNREAVHEVAALVLSFLKDIVVVWGLLLTGLLLWAAFLYGLLIVFHIPYHTPWHP